MKQTLKQIALVVMAMFVSVSMFAQMTTSSMSGKVTDNQGPVPGVAVIAVHTPSGSQYHAVTNAEGRYTMQGLRPGGPYEVTFQMMGYKTEEFSSITLQLAQTFTQDAVMEVAAENLDEALVVAETTKFKTEKTGASTNVSNREIMELPNTSRSISNLTKLSPYANGMSFAGSDGRSTNFTVDGANFNNNFGLSSSLPGGGTPISIDAIEEVQLVVAPFDVRQSNFVGGGINAITKSGTNTFKGTAYFYYHDEKLTGNKIAGEEVNRPAEMVKTYGVTFGGPIVKNKLFFFANFEMSKQPGQAITTNGIGKGVSESELKAISQKLKDTYGYDAGSYTDFPGGIENMKILARLDWNINNNHKLAFRFNKTDNKNWYAPNGNSCDDEFRNKGYNRASDQAQPFANNMYSQQNNVMSFALELNSRFSDKIQNQFIATYSYINDQRGTNSDLFPHVDIMDGKSGLSTGNFIPATSFGYELFTYKNGVTNKIWNATDNFTLLAGSHKFTFGLNYEHQYADNSYIRNGAGYYRYASVDDFLNNALPLSYCLYYAYDNAPETARINYDQFAAYAQDEWDITDKFKLTYGVRFDTIVFDNSDLLTNNAILAYDMGGRSVDTGKWPATTFQVNPRVGFNWDVLGDKSLKVRGGTGIFQGRLPLVFFTNMPTNSGMLLNQAVYSGQIKNGQVVYSDEVKTALQKLTAGGKLTVSTDEAKNILGLKREIAASEGSLQSTINGVDPNFKMPQVWKSSVAIDYQFPTSFPFTITGEGIFNKTINGVRLVDWNVNESAVEKGNRFSGVDNRYNYNGESYKYGKSTAYVLSNTKEGYGWIANVTLNMQPTKRMNIMLAYTHTVNKEISGMPGSNATSAYQGLYTVNGTNFMDLQCSQYVTPDKVIGNFSYVIPWKPFHGNGLHLNLFYSGYSPYGLSYVYSNDMNGDGNAADLMYIPVINGSSTNINFKTPADEAAYIAFAKQDAYLSSHQGQYAEAYSARSPWVNRFDFSIAEDFAFKIGKTMHNIQLSCAIDNVGNLFNSSWGIAKLNYNSNSSVTPLLKYEGVNAQKEPVFSMNKVDGAYPTETYSKWPTSNSQCWSILFGFKYFFN